ncbi:MND1 [Hepatospora eriocheir]|uniref:Meiotic nuclear division protein 1 n=1 Tax=Hepatospora eriocheir TaxID=1081669 RepID=A0A1X0QAF3_9MICR|nr:MND1 [Hepatospora eriocheir]
MTKRVSKDEKFTKIIAFFTETSEVYTIKELERKLSKHCNISSMAVKDIIQELVDESLIKCEKVGQSNYYWRFKYDKEHYYCTEIEKLDISITNFKEENKKLEKIVSDLEITNECTDKRNKLLNEYEDLKVKFERIEDIKENLKRYSKEEYKKMEKETEDSKNKINIHTDNIFTLQNFVCQKFNMERKDFNLNFGLEEDFDYLE